MAGKLDLKRSLDAYRAERDEFRVVDVPPLQYLMVDGHGDPNTAPAYREAIEALYPLAYALKFASRRELGRDYVVMPLEGQWWADDMTAFTAQRDKSQWHWTMLIMQPDWIDRSMLKAAADAVRTKATSARPVPKRLGEVRLETLDEGLCVQTLHVGAYDDEGPVLGRLHDELLPAEALRATGRHHEIYLSDARRVAPAKLRTILRQPVAPIDRARGEAVSDRRGGSTRR